MMPLLPNPFTQDSASALADSQIPAMETPGCALTTLRIPLAGDTSEPIAAPAVFIPDLESRASIAAEPATAGLLQEIEHVHEIFFFARKPIADDRSKLSAARFVLDEIAFMEAIEPLPLFL